VNRDYFLCYLLLCSLFSPSHEVVRVHWDAGKCSERPISCSEECLSLTRQCVNSPLALVNLRLLYFAVSSERCECCFPAVLVCLFVFIPFWNNQALILYEDFKSYCDRKECLEDLAGVNRLWSLYVWTYEEQEDIPATSKQKLQINCLSITWVLFCS